MTWRHNYGFSVHNEVRIESRDEQVIENLAQYVINIPFRFPKYNTQRRLAHSLVSFEDESWWK